MINAHYNFPQPCTLFSSDCDSACVGCMGSGPARCKKCASGYRLTVSKCLGNYKKNIFSLACIYFVHLNSSRDSKSLITLYHALLFPLLRCR